MEYFESALKHSNACIPNIWLFCLWMQYNGMNSEVYKKVAINLVFLPL